MARLALGSAVYGSVGFASGQMERDVDQLVPHTREYPYCDDLECWCHSNVGYHATVTRPFQATEAEAAAVLAWLESGVVACSR